MPECSLCTQVFRGGLNTRMPYKLHGITFSDNSIHLLNSLSEKERSVRLFSKHSTSGLVEVRMVSLDNFVWDKNLSFVSCNNCYKVCTLQCSIKSAWVLIVVKILAIVEGNMLFLVIPP